MSRGSRVTPPAGMTPAEVAQVEADRAVLDADPRTSGCAPRPPWLVERVLREAGRR